MERAAVAMEGKSKPKSSHRGLSRERRRVLRELAERARPFPDFFTWTVRHVFLWAFGLGHGLRLRGLSNVPEDGAVIVAPNHVSFYDAVLIGIALKRRMRSMAWEVYFAVPFIGWAMRKFGAFPVDPASSDADAYKRCLRILQGKNLLLVFPEGRRSRGESVLPFEAGVARMALRTGATIVPTTITGAAESWPRGHRFPHPRWRITVTFHPPVEVEACDARGAALREAIGELNERIAEPIRRRIAANRKAGNGGK